MFRYAGTRLSTVAVVGAFVLTGATASGAGEPGAPAPAAAPAAAATPDASVGVPSFKQGLWEYKRTLKGIASMKPQESTMTKCANPEVDIREKRAALEKRGCVFEPTLRNGDRYSSNWTCNTPTGVARFRDVLIIKGPDAYEDISEMRTSPQHATQQKIEARRRGECPRLPHGTLPSGLAPAPHGS